MQLFLFLPSIFSSIPVVLGAARRVYREPELKGIFAFSVFCFSFELITLTILGEKLLAGKPLYNANFLVIYCLLEFLFLTYAFRNFFSAKVQKTLVICSITYGAGLILLLTSFSSLISACSIFTLPYNAGGFFLTVLPIWALKQPKKSLPREVGNMLIYYSFFFFYLLNLNSDLLDATIYCNINFFQFLQIDTVLFIYFNILHYLSIAIGYALLKNKTGETGR